MRVPNGGWHSVKCCSPFPALLDRWQRQALEQAVPSSAEREEIKWLRAELKP
ncbi:hypothetical protein GCM10027348_03510 [Hymenobacter tenuis]